MTSTPKNPQTYQELKAELDSILDKLQHEDTDIDEALKLHKAGQEILKKIEAYLGKAAKESEK